MARIRSIKPDFFLDEAVAELQPMARLLFIGLWTLADRDGRLEDRPKRIKASLFPYDSADVEPLLGDLDAAGLIVRYEAEGVACIAIPGFEKHQRPHPKETSFGLPRPPAVKSREVSRQGADASRRVPVVVGCGDGNGDGCGNGHTPTEAPAAAAPAPAGEESPGRPVLVLAAQPTGKQRRKPSKAEALYLRLEQDREEACADAGVPYVPEGWAPARQNTALAAIAKATPEEQARFADGWDEYLDEPANAAKNPAYSLGFFIASRSTWESKALRRAEVAS